MAWLNGYAMADGMLETYISIGYWGTRGRKTARLIVFSVVLLSLVFSLATRTFAVPSPSHAIRQNLDTDTTPWVLPVLLTVIVLTVSYGLREIPSDPLLPVPHVCEILFTRPPPSC